MWVLSVYHPNAGIIDSRSSEPIIDFNTTLFGNALYRSICLSPRNQHIQPFHCLFCFRCVSLFHINSKWIFPPIFLIQFPLTSVLTVFITLTRFSWELILKTSFRLKRAKMSKKKQSKKEMKKEMKIEVVCNGGQFYDPVTFEVFFSLLSSNVSVTSRKSSRPMT